MFYITHKNSINYMTHTIKLILKAYRKTIFFLYVKIAINHYQKHKQRPQRKGRGKYQIFLKEKKKQKATKMPRKISKFY